MKQKLNKVLQKDENITLLNEKGLVRLNKVSEMIGYRLGSLISDEIDRIFKIKH